MWRYKDKLCMMVSELTSWSSESSLELLLESSPEEMRSTSTTLLPGSSLEESTLTYMCVDHFILRVEEKTLPLHGGYRWSPPTWPLCACTASSLKGSRQYGLDGGWISLHANLNFFCKVTVRVWNFRDYFRNLRMGQPLKIIMALLRFVSSERIRGIPRITWWKIDLANSRRTRELPTSRSETNPNRSSREQAWTWMSKHINQSTHETRFILWFSLPQRLAYVHVVEEATKAKDHQNPLFSLTYHFG
jgi:hypothetical protein